MPIESVATLSLTDIFVAAVKNKSLHGRLLNTFSMLENAGTRKIHHFQKFGYCSELILRHAAEESRHAWFFKAQLKHLFPNHAERATLYSDYRSSAILGGLASRHLLAQLDLVTCRYLQQTHGLVGRDRAMAAYLLVTLIVEWRARQVYSLYEQILRDADSKISVRAIMKEEERHLKDIEQLINERFGVEAASLKEALLCLEEPHFNGWVLALQRDTDHLLVAKSTNPFPSEGIRLGSRRNNRNQMNDNQIYGPPDLKQ